MSDTPFTPILSQASTSASAHMTSAQETLARIRSVGIQDNEDYVAAGEWLKKLAARIAEVEAEKEKITGPLTAALKAARAFFAAPLSAWQEASDALRSEVIRYKKAEEERKRESLAAAAAAIGPTGPTDLATYQALAADAGTPVPALQSVSFTERWEWRVVDEKKIPREYLVPDKVTIGKVVRALKDKTNIEGIEAYVVDGTSVRKK